MTNQPSPPLANPPTDPNMPTCLQDTQLDEHAGSNYSFSHEQKAQLSTMEMEVFQKNNKTCFSKIGRFIKRNKYFLLIIALMVIGGILFAIPSLQRLLMQYFSNNLEYFQKYSILNYWKFNLICASIHIILTIFFLPGKALFSISIAFITKDQIRATLVSFIGNSLSVVLVYYFVKCCLKNAVYRSYQQSLKFILQNEMVKENPWRASPIAWAIFIPLSVKAYFLAFTPLNFIQYWLGQVPIEFSYCLLFSMIGFEVKSIEEATHGFSDMSMKNFSRKSLIEIIGSGFFILFSQIIGIYLGWKYKKRYASFKMQKLLKANNLNTEACIL